MYQNLAASNTALSKASNPTIVTTSLSDLQSSMGTNGQNLSPFTWTSPSYAAQVANLFAKDSSLNTYIANAVSVAQNVTSSAAGGQGSYVINTGGSTSTSSGGNQALQGMSRFGAILNIFIPVLGSLIGIITSFIALGTSQSTNFNPILAIALLGNNIINLVVEVWLLGAGAITVLATALGLAPCLTVSNAVTAVTMWILPLLWGVLGLLFVNGCLMAYYIPMIPFILFTFGAIGWFMTVIEAMVAAPLIALGITHPEGHPVLGKADPAVLLIVNVFLRPTTMVIGLIAGIIMSYVGVWVLNQGYFGVAFTTDFWHTLVLGPSVIFALPAILTIYTALVIAIQHEAFNLIFIGDKIMRWLGAQGESLAQAADKALGEAKQGVSSGAGAFGKDVEAAGRERERKAKEAQKGVGTKSGGEGGGENLQIGQGGP